MVLFALGLFKLLIALVGILGALFFSVWAIFTKSRKAKLQNAGLTLLVSFLLILLISGVEWVVFPRNPKLDKLVLTAHREAPIGAYWLGLYADGSWEMGHSSREIEFDGTYRLQGDTIFLTCYPGKSFYNGSASNVFVIDEDHLVEVENSGIKALEVGLNALVNIQ